MISSLRGTAVHVEPDSVVVEVGGVGLSVAVTPQLARGTHEGDAVAVHTMLVVREDALSLYGFATRDELAAFSLLLGVTGVGPKSALGVLSTLTVDQIAEAVAADDDAPFRRVPGIGPKTAKLIVVQLTGKLAPARPTATAAGADASAALADQVTRALVGLGWSERVAAEAVAETVAATAPAERTTVPALLRHTLAALGPSRKEPVGG